jgi:tetratricopeptide (TPR) repeat protein
MAVRQVAQLLSSRRVLSTLVVLCTGALIGWFAYREFRITPMSEARRSYDEQNYPRAIELSESFLSEHPADQDAMLLLARSYGRLGRWAEAEVYFGQVRLNKPDDLHLRASGLIARRLWPEAATVYEQILQSWPMDGRALEQLSRIRIQQERHEEAMLLAKRLVRVPSHEVAGYLIIGTIEFHHNSFARAAEAFEEVVRRSPNLKSVPGDAATTVQMLAESLLVLGRAADAEQYALQARELSQSPESCWILGLARQHQGDHEGARRYWEETVARDPNNVRAIRELGRDCLVREQPAEALKWLLRAIEIDPNDPGTLQALIATYRRLGQDEEARTLIERLKNLSK